MKQMSFSKPLPWTDKSLYLWFTSSCHKITFDTTVSFSEADAANQQIFIQISTNSTLLLQNKWMDTSSGTGIADTIALFVHEARHLNGYGHTAGSLDATLNELGAWGAEYYFYKLAGGYSNITNSIMQYTSEALLGDAQNILSWSIVNPQLTLKLNNLNKVGNQAVINFTSPQPYSQHQLQESTDFKSWDTVGAVFFTNITSSNILATTGITRSNNFYRVMLLGP